MGINDRSEIIMLYISGSHKQPAPILAELMGIETAKIPNMVALATVRSSGYYTVLEYARIGRS